MRTLLALLAMAMAAAAQDAGPRLVAMTFNIRYGTAKDGPHSWPNRRDLVAEAITARQPHVLGVQEALAFQMQFLRERFPQYRSVGVGRDGGNRGEFSGLFLDRRRVDVLDHGTFWLAPESDQVGQKGWDAALPRVCTWARCRDRRTQAEFVVGNTHFDHRGRDARRESARLLARHPILRGTPALLLGDLNAREDSPPLAALREAGWRDTFRQVHPEARDVGTFTDFMKVTNTHKIDYVLATQEWHTEDAELVVFRTDGRLPSDHLPVTATLRLRARAR